LLIQQRVDTVTCSVHAGGNGTTGPDDAEELDAATGSDEELASLLSQMEIKGEASLLSQMEIEGEGHGTTI
jgi:hypothetical protein